MASPNPLAEFTKTLAEGGILDAPAAVKSLEETVKRQGEELAQLKSQLEAQQAQLKSLGDATRIGKQSRRAAKALRKAAETALEYRKSVSRVKARKTEDGWELEVERDDG